MDRDEMRDRIVAAVGPHVVFDGWGMKSFRLAAEEVGFDRGAADRMFPGGPIEAVEHYYDWIDRCMLATLAEQDLAAMKVRGRIAAAIRSRLMMLGDREVVRRTASLLMLPQNVQAGLRITYRAVDAMWYAAGDTSTDFNFYTRRALLAGVYSATMLYWLSDSSEDSADTWTFLDRRIDDMLRVTKWRGDLGKRLKFLPNPLRIFRQAARGRGLGKRADFTAAES